MSIGCWLNLLWNGEGLVKAGFLLLNAVGDCCCCGVVMTYFWLIFFPNSFRAPDLTPCIDRDVLW